MREDASTAVSGNRRSARTQDKGTRVHITEDKHDGRQDDLKTFLFNPIPEHDIYKKTPGYLTRNRTQSNAMYAFLPALYAVP